MEKIIAIVEIDETEGYTSYSGFMIKTTKQNIKLLIDNMQSCCENWGYFMSEDDLGSFIGSEVLNVSLTDTALNTKKVDEIGIYEGDTMFVNIETSNGLLQFVAYNEHNGYYGHEAKVISEQLNHSETL